MHKLPKLIAISGWKGSGKDTAGAYFVREYNYQPISFAYELKNMVAQLYGVNRDWLDDRTKKEMPLMNMPVIPTDPFSSIMHHILSDELSSGFWTPRALCILEGSIKRAVHSNYWTRKVIEQAVNDKNNNYVITDMRYSNEADVLRLMIPSTKTIRMERLGHNISTQDSSERDLDDYRFDHVLKNDGDIVDLEKSIDKLVREL